MNKQKNLFWRILVNLSSIYLLMNVGTGVWIFIQEGGKHFVTSVSISGGWLLFDMIAIGVLFIEFPMRRWIYQVKMFFKKNSSKVEKKETRRTVKKAVSK